MVNAYYLGQLTAQPVKLQKMAANSKLKQLIMDKFTKAAFDEPRYEGMPEGGEWSPAAAAEATPPVDIAALEQEVKDLKGGALTRGARSVEGGLSKAQTGITGLSSRIGTSLGGEAGKGFLKNPHTRTIAALLALLGTGAGGAYALSGGSGDKKER